METVSGVVDADDHQFLICDVEGGSLSARLGATRMLVDSDDDSDNVSVITGAQYGDVSVTATLLHNEPTDLDPDWEDAVELSVACESGLAVAPLMDAPVLTIVRGGGDYRLRISARGRDAGVAQEHRADEDGEPLEAAAVVEQYLIEAWRQAPHDPVLHRLTSRFSTEAYQWPPPEPAAAGHSEGLAGGRKVGAGLDSGLYHGWTGDVGAVEVAATLTGTRRRLFPIITRTCGTFGEYTYMGGGELVPGNEEWTYAHRSVDEGGDRLTGRDHILRLEIRTIDRPRTSTVGWNWWTKPHWHGGHRVLATDSQVHLTFTTSKDEDGEARTTVDVIHEGLPREWVDPMRHWWTWRLALAEQRGFGTR